MCFFPLNTMFKIFGWCLDKGSHGNQTVDREMQLCAFKTPVSKSNDLITICNSIDIEKRND